MANVLQQKLSIYFLEGDDGMTMTMTLTVVFLFILKCLIFHCFGVSSCTVDESKSVWINVFKQFLAGVKPLQE